MYKGGGEWRRGKREMREVGRERQSTCVCLREGLGLTLVGQTL